MCVGTKSLAKREHRTSPGETLDSIKSVLEARARQNVPRESKSVASRAGWEFQGKFMSVASRASWAGPRHNRKCNTKSMLEVPEASAELGIKSLSDCSKPKRK